MRKENKKGCVPSGDVCLKHCEPLICRHGCSQALKHKCKDLLIGDSEIELIKKL